MERNSLEERIQQRCLGAAGLSKVIAAIEDECDSLGDHKML